MYYFIIIKLIVLFNKDELNWSKVTVMTFIMLLKILISNKCCSLKKKKKQGVHKILGNTTVFNIDDNKKELFLSTKISILEWFLNNHVKLKTGVIMLKIQLCHQGINHIKYMQIENGLKNVIIFENITVFHVSAIK